MIISERIFAILKEKGISQKTFSEMTGIAESTISDWKRKKTNPGADKILLISEALGISAYELLGSAKRDGKQQAKYVVVDADTEEYKLLESFSALESDDRTRLFGYLEALKNKTE